MEPRERIAEQVAKLPAELKAVLDAALAAGNILIDFDMDDGTNSGQVFVVLDHPFRVGPEVAPAGIKYMEQTDCDPRIFGFYTADESFAVVTVKMKPMKLEPLPVGPENPTAKHIAAMEQREREMEAAAKQREVEAAPPPPPPPLPATWPATSPMPDAAKRFIASMTITYEMWHDGDGYNLDALRAIPAAELPAIEALLINHSPRDWRDIEALGQLDSEASRKVVNAALGSSDEHVRYHARLYASEKQSPVDRERLLLQSLAKNDLSGGLSQAIDEAAEFHPPAVIHALLDGALNRTGEVAVNFAGLLYYIHGKSEAPFDWNHRPFFLRFHTADREERKAAFRELCQTIGVDVTKFMPR